LKFHFGIFSSKVLRAQNIHITLSPHLESLLNNLDWMYSRLVMGVLRSRVEYRENMLFLMEHVDWRRCYSWKSDLKGRINMVLGNDTGLSELRIDACTFSGMS
jgi:hypothetical protein